MWNLYLNANKCKVVHVESKNQICNHTMELNAIKTITIAKCEEEKDMGVIFDCKFDVCLQGAISEANRLVGIYIRRTFI